MSVFVCLISVFCLQSGIAIDCGGANGERTGQMLLRAFVAFEPGEVAARSALVLRDRGGNDLVADIVPTAHWQDGSIRFVAISASLAAHRRKGPFRLMVHRTPRPHGQCLELTRRGRSVLVDTGPMTVKVGGTEAGFVSHLTWEGKRIETLSGSLGLRARFNGLAFEPAHGLIGIDAGRAHAVVHLSGRLIGDAESLGPEYSLRLGFLAGSGQIECRLRLRGGEFEGTCTGLEFLIDPPWSRGGAAVAIKAGGSKTERALGRAQSIKVRSTPGRVDLSLGDVSEKVSTANGLEMILKGCRPDLLISLPEFARLHPWSVSATEGGPLEISLLNEHCFWEPFFSFERSFVIALLPAGRRACLGPVLSERAPLGLACDVKRRSLIFSPVVRPRGCESLSDLFFEVARLLQKRLRQEWAHWDGFMDYGDYRKSYGIWANQEYDPAFGLIKKFLWTNDRADLEMARVALDHWLFFDRAGPGDPDAPVGVPWVHGADHRSGRTEPGHMWLDGILAYSLLTGEKEYGEGALQIGGALASALPRLKNTKEERNLAWSLIGLSALTEAGFDRFEEAMDQAALWLRSRQTKSGLMAFRETQVAEEKCYTTNSWVTAGITVDALYRHFVVTGDRRSADCAVGAMRALLRIGRDTSKGHIFQTIVTEQSQGELRQRKGPISAGKAALFSLGAARAFEITGEKLFKNCARSILEKALIEIKRDVPKYVGEDLALILHSGPDVIAATSDR